MKDEGAAHPASLKHELRTPLNQIIGYTEMLVEEAEDRQQASFLPDLGRIHAAGRQLLAILDGLFDPAKAGLEKMDPAWMHHEIRTPLNQIVGYTEMLQEEASERGLDSFIP